MIFVWGILGVLAIGYFLVINILGGRVYFSEVFLIIGIIALIICFKYNYILNISFVRRYLKIFKGIMYIGIAAFILIEGAILIYPKKSLEKADLVIVLGAGLKGVVPSLTLKHRLDATIQYLNKTGYDGEIVVSGGQGPGEDITEAEAMKSYLVKNGVNADRIIKEDKSTSTSENLEYSKEVISKELNKNVSKELNTTIITTDFHAMRSNMLAKRKNYYNINLYTSSTEWYLIPNMYLREFFAFTKSMIFDR
ncbi:MAG: YdcF family protein [Clostridium sp.]|uniref:YdcF family protein n=1 Tax=Clostridium sp. TaxID=1506 RepID=UPI003EE54AB0